MNTEKQRLTISAALVSMNRLERICCKVTGFNILIAADQQKQKKRVLFRRCSVQSP